MITITVHIVSTCNMAKVYDSEGIVMEGNYWDFYSECHNILGLPYFDSLNGFVKSLSTYHRSLGSDVKVIRSNYSY